jgi:type VI protein secretion system component VasK
MMTGAPELAENDLSLGRILGESFTLFREDAKVPGAFTRSGFQSVDKRLKAIEGGEPLGGNDDASWIVGPREPLTKDKIDGIRRRYFETYEKQWRALLATVYPREPHDLAEAQSLLRRHQDGRPLVLLFKVLADNLELRSKLEEAASEAGSGTFGKILDKLGGKKGTVGTALASASGKAKAPEMVLRDRFAALVEFGVPSTKEAAPPAPIEAYYQEVGKLQQALSAFDESKDTKALRKEVNQSKQRVAEMAEHYGRDGWGAVLNKMLMPLFTGVEGVVVGTGDEAANRAWCDAVVLPFDELLRDRYPFRLDGKDASIGDLEKFFQPKQGTLWAHYQDVLKPDVESIGKRFRLKEKSSIQYRGALVTFLTRAEELTDLLFPGGGDKVAPPLEVRLKSASGPSGTATKVTLRIGPGKPIEYGNWAERWEHVSWPAAGARLAILGDIRGLPRDLSNDGDWAIFHLLDRAARSQTRDREDYLLAEWTITSPALIARMDFKPAGLLDALHAFEIPRTIAPGRGSCER